MKRILSTAILAASLSSGAQTVITNGTFLCMGGVYTNSFIIEKEAALAGWGAVTGTVINRGAIVPVGGTLFFTGTVTNYGTVRIEPVGNGSIMFAGRAINFTAPKISLTGTELTVETVGGFENVIETSTNGPNGPWRRSVSLPADGWPHTVTTDSDRPQRYFRARVEDQP